MNIAIVSFSGGEMTLQIDARSDVEKYASGCRTLENFIPRIYGGVERRPGTKFIRNSTFTGTPIGLLLTLTRV